VPPPPRVARGPTGSGRPAGAGDLVTSMVTPMPSRRRYSRRRGMGVAAARRRLRLTLAGGVVAVVVGGFFAVVAVQVGPAERTYQSSIDAGYAASIGPIAQETNATGSELSSMVEGHDSHMAEATLVATLESMVGEADSAVDQFETVTPPAGVASAASACGLALKDRADAMGVFHRAVANLLDGVATSASARTGAVAGAAIAESSIERLGSVLLSADHAWSACRRELLADPGSRHDAVPVSAWVGSRAVWGAASVSRFVSDLVSIAPAVAGRPFVIVAVWASPPAFRVEKGVDVLPLTRDLAVHVVVEDQGSTTETGVTVRVSLDPVGDRGHAATSTSTASIEPGGSFSFHPPALAVTPGASYVLEVEAAGPGQTSPATRRYRIEIASANGVATATG